ncbi:MAG: hypothetical protein Q9O62_11015 [Ardenticatenia bacterium]|nr:hypothetical protein [Ardenticatenia bacterium]
MATPPKGEGQAGQPPGVRRSARFGLPLGQVGRPLEDVGRLEGLQAPAGGCQVPLDGVGIGHHADVDFFFAEPQGGRGQPHRLHGMSDPGDVEPRAEAAEQQGEGADDDEKAPVVYHDRRNSTSHE